MTLIQDTLAGLSDRMTLLANLGVGMVLVTAFVCCAAYWLVWR